MRLTRFVSSAPARWLREIAALLCVAFLLSGCAEDEKIVRYHPFLANLPDAKTGLAPVGSVLGNASDPTAVAGDSLVIEQPNGSKKLVSGNIRALLYHLSSCLANDELELFYDQLVADETKQDYRAKGKDGFAFMQFLKEHEEDVAAMVSRMPMGEHTPSVALDQPSRNVFKLRLTGIAKKDINLSVLWVVHDKGTWKLMWIE